MRLFTSALVLSVALLQVPAASAATLTLGGGTTTVSLDPAVVTLLSGAGITLSPLGTAMISGTDAMFPITGGTLDTDTNQAVLEHDGSGLRFMSMAATLDLMNFLINADITPGSASGLLTGDAMGAVVAAGVPLFDIGPGLTLSLRSEAAGALTQVFGVPDLTGTVIGTAAAAPVVVPEPSTFVLLAGGGLVLAWKRHRSAKVRN